MRQVSACAASVSVGTTFQEKGVLTIRKPQVREEFVPELNAFGRATGTAPEPQACEQSGRASPTCASDCEQPSDFLTRTSRGYAQVRFGYSMSQTFSSDAGSRLVRLVTTHRRLGRGACRVHDIDRHHGRNGMFEDKLHC